MPYPALVVANAFVRMGLEAGRPVDPMKMQKLVYLAHGFNLALLDKPLISERIEAWPYGPVVPTLYYTFKHYRSQSITEEATTDSGSRLDATTQDLLSQVWAKYGGRNAIDLSMLTHEPGYAWDITRKGCQPGSWSSPEISQDLIKDEFIRRTRASR